MYIDIRFCIRFPADSLRGYFFEWEEGTDMPLASVIPLKTLKQLQKFEQQKRSLELEIHLFHRIEFLIIEVLRISK